MSFTDSEHPANTSGCLCCGECCRGDMNVYLNPGDLYLMARFLEIDSTAELFSLGYVIIDRERSGAPLPRIRFSRGRAGCCPFLENRLIDEGRDSSKLLGLCRLHPEYKPLVCHLAPLHRTVDLESESEHWGFIHPLPGCPGYNQPEDRSGEVPAGLRARLDSEAAFFSRLSGMLDRGVSEEDIIKQLYFHLDCQK